MTEGKKRSKVFISIDNNGSNKIKHFSLPPLFPLISLVNKGLKGGERLETKTNSKNNFLCPQKQKLG